MKSLVLALSAVALFSTAAVANDAIPTKTVSFGDLNLATNDGVSTLRSRLVAAADEVCAPAKSNLLAQSYDTCRRNAVKSAINQISTKISERLASSN